MENNTEELSSKHKLFADTYLINGFNALKAYKEVYKDAKEKSAESASSRLLENVKIQEYLQKAKNEASKKLGYDQQRLIIELEDAQEMAKKQNNANAYIKATEVKAKLLGLNEPEKLETKITGLGASAIIVED